MAAKIKTPTTKKEPKHPEGYYLFKQNWVLIKIV